MNMVWHLTAKELRSHRVALALWFVSVLAAAGASAYLVLAAAPAPGPAPVVWTLATALRSILPVASWALCITITAGLFLSDPAKSTTAFWMTRPVGCRNLLFAKAGVVLVLVLVPAVCEMLVLCCLGFAGRALLAAFAENAVVALAVCAGTAAIASLAERKGRVLLLGIGILVAALVCALLLQTAVFRNWMWPFVVEDSSTKAISCLWAMKVAVIVFGSAIVAVQYRARHFRWMPFVVFASAVAIVSMPSWWCVDFFAETPSADGDLPTLSPVSDGLRVQRRNGPLVIVTGVVGSVRLPDGSSLDPVAMHRMPFALTADGANVGAAGAYTRYPEPIAPLAYDPAALAERMAPFKVLNPPPKGSRELALFFADKRTIGRLQPARIAVEGRVEAMRRILEVEAEFPLAAGQAHRGGAWVVDVAEVDSDGDRVRCLLEERCYLSFLAGMPETHNQWAYLGIPVSLPRAVSDFAGYALVNRARGEVLVPEALRPPRKRGGTGHLIIARRELAFPLDLLPAEGRAEWLRGASLVCLRLRETGRVTCPFSAKDLSLAAEAAPRR